MNAGGNIDILDILLTMRLSPLLWHHERQYCSLRPDSPPHEQSSPISQRTVGNGDTLLLLPRAPKLLLIRMEGGLAETEQLVPVPHLQQSLGVIRMTCKVLTQEIPQDDGRLFQGNIIC